MNDATETRSKERSPNISRRRSKRSGQTDEPLCQCEICEQYFSSHEKLEEHAISHRSTGEEAPQEGATPSCDEASASDVITALLRSGPAQEITEDGTTAQAQRRTKMGKVVGRVTCDVCNESFANHHVLKVHMRRHTGERPYLCTLCESTFTQKSALIGHMTTHANEQHKCGECDQLFTQARSLKKHMKFHTGECKMKKLQRHKEFRVRVPAQESPSGKIKYKNRYKCDICDKHFTSGSQVHIHRRVHTNERPFECGVCGRKFKQKITLSDHEATHRDDRPYECKKCGSRYKQLRILRQHLKSALCERKLRKKMGAKLDGQERGKTPELVVSENSAQNASGLMDYSEEIASSGHEDHIVDENERETGKVHVDSSKSEFLCEQCGKVFHFKKYLTQHMKSHSDVKPHVCSVCKKGFRLKAVLREHMEIHANGKPHKCQTCQKQFKTQRCLQNHIGRNICTGIRPYSCGECHKSFMYTRFLEKHKCLNAPPKVFNCEMCGRNFTRRNLLTEHIRTHTGERPLSCETCGKRFAKRALLRQHSLTHSSNRTQECPQCRRKFASNATLKSHMTVHSSEKKYACKLCEKTFKQARSLRMHTKLVHRQEGQVVVQPIRYLCAHCGKTFKHARWMTKHYCPMVEGAKRFRCEFCDKTFDKKQQLEVHLRTHTGHRPYECPECGRRFTQSGSLKDHMVTHTGAKLFACGLCGARFTRMNSLRRHNLIIHVGVEPFMCGKCGLTFKYQKSLKKHENVCTKQEEAETSEAVPKLPEAVMMADGAALEQQVHENILGNIKRAMTEAGIEMKDNIQYHIVVGENSGELTVHYGGSAQ